jgi:CHASE1-domain containing sensor protein
MADAPAVKPRCKEDKNKLQKLIDDGKVDIRKTEDTDYINSVRHKYFRERSDHNFRRNFRGYARALTIAKHYNGYRARLAAGEGKLLSFVNYILHHI